ncbi:hypothetical protein F2Q69_00036712 [Brassica cretica]|uniref:Uncharacterized protein n=1 Tax=Brassica cretica TaxID=69181 RepID=A0A8S9SG57_BRACR|nr:hypothetical protein F2Q69_00036712 [Brassica cretica]
MNTLDELNARSDTYLGELNPSDTYISELDELIELSDTTLELSEQRNTEERASLVAGHEEKAGRKVQEEKLREWRYNKRTAEMRAQSERDQEKEAKKSRPERDKWKKPLSKEETPSTRTKEKRNKGFEKWLESFKARIHQKAKDYLGPIFDEEEEPFGRWTMDDDLDPIFDEKDDHLDDDLGPIFDEEDDHLDDDSGPIFDEEKEPEAASVLLAVQTVAEDVVDSGPEADNEKDLTTAYASGDILGSFSCDKLVQPFVCKEYDPVKLLRHEEGLQHLIFEPREETRDQRNNNHSSGARPVLSSMADPSSSSAGTLLLPESLSFSIELCLGHYAIISELFLTLFVVSYPTLQQSVFSRVVGLLVVLRVHATSHPRPLDSSG